MEGISDKHEFHDIQEPSLESSDPATRKLARQQRLTKRLEAAKRLKDILEGTAPESVYEKPLLIKTIDDSNEKLFQIFVEGKELVTNIRVSAGTREIERRDAELAARNARYQKLEEEGALALEKMTEITDKWDNVHDSNDPLDLCEDLKEQRIRCTTLIAQKDALIRDFKEELKLAEERFMSDRSDMLEDVSILARRIDEQVLVMKRSYFSELEQIEDAITETRDDILAKQDREWKKLYEKRETDEVSSLAKHFSMMESNDEEIGRVHVKHDEKYRENKIRLDTDVQLLELEREQIKALCLVNSEKLDYNYQVLKKREDENVIIKNNQRRNLNRLQGEVSKLRRKMEEKDLATKQELTQLNKDLCRFHKNILDIEKKADHFSEVNDRKFQQIWDMKTEEAMECLSKIAAADKVIHEDILGMEGIVPVMKILKKEDLVSYQAAIAMINEVSASKSEWPAAYTTKQEDGRTVHQQKILRQVLSLVADHSGFLIEEKLEELLNPYSEEQRTLVRLDNVFNALAVKNKEEIEMMLVFFLPYASCSICPAEEEEEAPDEASRAGKGEEPLQDSDNSATSVLNCWKTHPLVIEKTYVLKAMREFIAKLHASELKERAEADVRVAKDRCTISRLMSRQDVEAYWASFRDVFPQKEEAVWEALYQGLNKYHSILQEREKVKTKVQSLQQQNTELRRIVEKYVTKRL